MNFTELKEQLKQSSLDQIRIDSHQAFECVFQTTQLEHIHQVLHKYFGAPLKPAGKGPSQEAKKYASNYGGIRNDQTLYWAEKNEQSCLGMIWPWNDKTLATLKLFHIEGK